jgi:hypothetical protein
MGVKSNGQKADMLERFLVAPRAGTGPKRVLRTKIKIALKNTKIPSGVVNHWCVPMHRSVTKADLEDLRNIIDLVRGSSDTDLADVELVYRAMVI